MSATTKRDPVRDRIIKTAGELFYAEGITAVGVDRISAAAPVSKRTLYQRFAAKDDLVTAYLKTIGDESLNYLLPAAEDALPPLDAILGVFDALHEQSRQADFRGCPFVNASAELPDPAHPGRVLAVDYKLRLQQFFARQAVRADAADPQELAEQLVMLFDGAMAFALVRATVTPPSVLNAARALVRCQMPDAASD